MENPEIRPPPFENAWTDGYQNWQEWLVPDMYPCAKLQYDPIRGFCSPHMRSCLPNVHSASFSFFYMGSSNSLPPRALRRFWRSIRQKTSFRTRMSLLGVPRTIFLHFDPIFAKKRKFLVDFRREKISAQNGAFMGASSVNTSSTTSYAFARWVMNRQIDPHKSKYELNFYPRSRLTPHSAHARRLQPFK